MNFTRTRKLVSGLILLATGVLITYWKGDIPTNLLNLMQTLYGAFVLGNCFEHGSRAVIEKLTKKEEHNENIK